MHAALAAKRPVIASKLRGLTETVKDGVNGLIFPAGDAAALAACFERLLDEPELLAQLGAHCTKPKTTAAYVDELEALYVEAPLREMWKRDYHGLMDVRSSEMTALKGVRGLLGRSG
jgi:glycosyltransferase involved in cell wall biosynthesis